MRIFRNNRWNVCDNSPSNIISFSISITSTGLWVDLENEDLCLQEFGGLSNPDALIKKLFFKLKFKPFFHEVMWSKSGTNCFAQLLNPLGIFSFQINSGQQQSWYYSMKSVQWGWGGAEWAQRVKSMVTNNLVHHHITEVMQNISGNFSKISLDGKDFAGKSLDPRIQVPKPKSLHWVTQRQRVSSGE